MATNEIRHPGTFSQYNSCAECPAWRIPVNENHRICLIRQDVTYVNDWCPGCGGDGRTAYEQTHDCEPAIPFTDDTVGSDAELRALHEGRVAMGAGE